MTITATENHRAPTDPMAVQRARMRAIDIAEAPTHNACPACYEVHDTYPQERECIAEHASRCLGCGAHHESAAAERECCAGLDSYGNPHDEDAARGIRDDY